MKIVYACAGEGRGHAARTAALWPELSRDWELELWCPPSVRPFLEEHCRGGRTEEIPGLHFSLKEHRVDYWETFVKNLPIMAEARKTIGRMAEEMRRRGADGVISDFEPLTALAAAKAGLPLLNLNHPAVVRHYLSLRPDALGAKLVAALMTPPAQKNLICSFYDGDVGPILRREIRRAAPRRGDYLLVYLKPSSSEAVRRALACFPRREFRVFPDPERDFTAALAGCAGVVAPAGHQLLSEALFLGKPVLALPQKGQYEQRLNARMLRASGWGREGSLERLEEDLARFLTDLPRFPFRADRFHRFRLEDHTARAAGMIREFFYRERRRERPSPRVSCDYFRSVPGKIRRLREMTA